LTSARLVRDASLDCLDPRLEAAEWHLPVIVGEFEELGRFLHDRRQTRVDEEAPQPLI
jgi:hypothetical protein